MMRPAQIVTAISLSLLLVLNGAGGVWAQNDLTGSQEGPNWILIVLRGMSIVAIILAIVIDVNLIIGTLEWHRRRYQKKAQIEIENLGNVLSPFRLRAEDPSDELQFHLLYEDVELGYETIPATREGAAVQSEEKAKKASSAPKVDLKKAQETASQARGFSYFIANLLGTIASILPNSMAAPLRRIVSNLRQKQAAVSRVERAPRQMTRKASQTRRLFKKKPSSKAKSHKQTKQGPDSPPLIVTEEMWSETPEVEPGGTVAIELHINPTGRPRETEDYSITLLSQAMGAREAPTVSETYDITFEKVSLIRHALPFILIALLFIIEIALIWFLVTSTGLLGS